MDKVWGAGVAEGGNQTMAGEGSGVSVADCSIADVPAMLAHPVRPVMSPIKAISLPKINLVFEREKIIFD